MGSHVPIEQVVFLLAQAEGSVRLNPRYGDGNYDQRVEVLYDGRWGTVCDKDWDKSDGTTICQELDLGSPNDINTKPTFRYCTSIAVRTTCIFNLVKYKFKCTPPKRHMMCSCSYLILPHLPLASFLSMSVF